MSESDRASDHDELLELAAGYALGALDPDERQRFADHLPGCAECQRAVAEGEDTLSEALLELPPAELSHSLVESVKTAISLDGPASDEVARARAEFLARARQVETESAVGGAGAGNWPLAAAAGLLLALGAGLWGLAQGAAGRAAEQRAEALATQLAQERAAHDKELASATTQLTRATGLASQLERVLEQAVNQQQLDAALAAERLSQLRRIAELLSDPEAEVRLLQARAEGAAAGSGAVGRVVVRGAELAFVAQGLAPSPPDKVYELWAIPQGGAPVPAGLFAVAEDGHAVGLHAFAEAPAAPGQTTYALTLEPAGGQPAPTGEILLLSAPG